MILQTETGEELAVVRELSPLLKRSKLFAAMVEKHFVVFSDGVLRVHMVRKPYIVRPNGDALLCRDLEQAIWLLRKEKQDGHQMSVLVNPGDRKELLYAWEV
jgi:hypothetical protein